jgi:hypothetical protein
LVLALGCSLFTNFALANLGVLAIDLSQSLGLEFERQCHIDQLVGVELWYL